MTDHNTPEALEMILYKFLNVHDAFEKQRLLLEQHNEHLTTLIRDFTQHVQNHKDLDPVIRQQITASFHAVITSLENRLGDEVQKATVAAINKIVHPLTHAAEKTHHVLEDARKQSKKDRGKFLIFTVFCSLFCSILTTLAALEFIVR